MDCYCKKNYSFFPFPLFFIIWYISQCVKLCCLKLRHQGYHLAHTLRVPVEHFLGCTESKGYLLAHFLLVQKNGPHQVQFVTPTGQVVRNSSVFVLFVAFACFLYVFYVFCLLFACFLYGFYVFCLFFVYCFSMYSMLFLE